jgi:hypothetical protein
MLKEECSPLSYQKHPHLEVPFFSHLYLAESEWVIIFNAKWAIFKLYHGKNMLDFDEMMLMMMSTLF